MMTFSSTFFLLCVKTLWFLVMITSWNRKWPSPLCRPSQTPSTPRTRHLHPWLSHPNDCYGRRNAEKRTHTHLAQNGPKKEFKSSELFKGKERLSFTFLNPALGFCQTTCGEHSVLKTCCKRFEKTVEFHIAFNIRHSEYCQRCFQVVLEIFACNSSYLCMNWPSVCHKHNSVLILLVWKSINVYLQAIWFLRLFQLLTDHLIVVLNQTQSLPASIMSFFHFLVFLNLQGKVISLFFFNHWKCFVHRHSSVAGKQNYSSPFTYLNCSRVEALWPDRHQ